MNPVSLLRCVIALFAEAFSLTALLAYGQISAKLPDYALRTVGHALGSARVHQHQSARTPCGPSASAGYTFDIGGSPRRADR